MTSSPPQSSSKASDIFSLSDQVLSDRLQFVKEIGFGNWGSVWLCRPKHKSKSRSVDESTRVHDVKIAVKLVHRTNSSTTIARVQSLWNEMKIVRSFKDNPHPSIILFHSFVITPSYALITMAYLPMLIPVEVEESKAKQWFHSLLSGVEFLHKRGVVHNDIKPANILLNERRVPVFVDFGFAEKYDMKSSEAFYSSLMYGTPEYLSPERARGISHDTRKSDLWSLGVTFFEILIGRTPFEYIEGKELSTQEDTERYWVRTLRGKWVGTWKMSKGIEKLLKRMIVPTADLRCDATDAMTDAYWHGDIEVISHKRSFSAPYTPSPSVTFDKKVTKLVDASSFLSPRSAPKNRNKENFIPTPKSKEPKSIFSPVNHTRSKPVPTPRAPVQTRNRPAIPPLADLFPVDVPPPALPKSPPVRARSSDNISDPSGIFVSFHSINNGSAARMPLGAPRQPLSAVSQNLPLALTEPRTAPNNKGRNVANRKGGVLKDLTGLNNHSEVGPAMVLKEKPKGSPKGKVKENQAVVSGKEQDSVRKRVIEWEKEREKLREMQRLEEFANERDDEQGDVSFTTTTTSLQETEENIQVAKVAVRTAAQIVPIAPSFLDLSTTQSDSIPSSMNESSIGSFKQSLKMSIDKGIRIVKSSSLAGRAVPGHSPFVEGVDEPEWNIRLSERQSWEIVPDAKSSYPDVRQAVRNQRIAEDTKMDNMALWMRNVDKVVEDARQKFDSASAGVPQSPLPIPPTSRSSSQNHTAQSSRFPRKALRASQIFSDQNTSSTSAFTQDDAPSVHKTLPALPNDDANNVPGILATSTPSRPRRATVTSRSPEPLKKQASFDIDTGSPSRRKEKSKSHGNLLRPIETIDRLELELQKEAMPPTSPRLSAVFDKSLFIAPPIGHTEDESENDDITYTRSKSLDFNHLTSSVQVKPHPPRKSDRAPPVVLDTPNRRRIEGVYDRFLMATGGVKRGGRRNQSVSLSHVKDVPSTSPSPPHPNDYNIHRALNTSQPVPSSVFNDDMKLPRSVDELGMATREASPDVSHYKEDGNNTVALVRRALKAVVTGKAATRQLQ